MHTHCFTAIEQIQFKSGKIGHEGQRIAKLLLDPERRFSLINLKGVKATNVVKTGLVEVQ